MEENNGVALDMEWLGRLKGDKACEEKFVLSCTHKKLKVVALLKHKFPRNVESNHMRW